MSCFENQPPKVDLTTTVVNVSVLFVVYIYITNPMYLNLSTSLILPFQMTMMSNRIRRDAERYKKEKEALTREATKCVKNNEKVPIFAPPRAAAFLIATPYLHQEHPYVLLH